MSFTYLTLVFPLNPDRVEEVDQCLACEGKEAYSGGKIRTELRGQGVHFLSISTVPDAYKAFLILESSHDGGREEALKTLSAKLSTPLKAIFGVAGFADPSGDLLGFLKRHSVETGTGLFATPGLNHRGVPSMTVDRIFREEAFADQLRNLVRDAVGEGPKLDQLKAIREKAAKLSVADDLMQPDDVAFLVPPDAAQTGFSVARLAVCGLVTFSWPLLILAGVTTLLLGLCAGYQAGPWVGINTVVSAIFFWLVVMVALLLGLYCKLRQLEKTDWPDDSMPDYDVLSDVMSIENDGDVNHLASISVMKPGLLRKLALKVAFWVVGQLAKTNFRPGFLGDIGTIHSARWVLLPGTDKLLFFSNYGGSWESYLEDFITKAANGLTGVWSNTLGFPRTTNLFFDGARDGDRFKRWARRQQRPSHFWYRAYPNKTTHIVRLNAAIRHGLLTAATEDQAIEWFGLFGSRQRRANSLHTTEIQKIAFGGMRQLADGACCLLRLPDDAAKAREWLRGVLPVIAFGDEKPDRSALTIAFTASGLKRLGLAEGALATFPAAFLQGMDWTQRAESVLMDTGNDKPSNWAWGYGDDAVDAVLYLLAAVPDRNDKSNFARKDVGAYLAKLKALGGRVVSVIETERMPQSGPAKEPFGFVDGISQPILRGSWRWPENQASRDVVEPGEIILGYPDNRGFLPPSPSIEASADPQNHLPAKVPISANHDWPDPNRSTANAARDFGSNGSFLVIRQLEQDVETFHKQAMAMARTLKQHPLVPKGLTRKQVATWIKSKAVGRWPDGSSLTRHPNAPATGWNGKQQIIPDNDFLHGVEDPEGTRCPFGSHVRRSNPRDSFTPGSEETNSVVNRHRILRAGRNYAQTHRGGRQKRGLLFVCLNADLERQFEFIQQTWNMSRQFHGLTDEVDPIIGRGKKGGRLTIPTNGGPIIVQGFQDVVRVRGGSYFFLPGQSALRYLAS